MFYDSTRDVPAQTKQRFYDETTEIGKQRKWSREVDFGVWWRQTDRPTSRRWRVTWIQDTGEVYAITGETTVILLGVEKDEDRVEKKLAGWADVCSMPYSLEWAYRKLNA